MQMTKLFSPFIVSTVIVAASASLLHCGTADEEATSASAATSASGAGGMGSGQGGSNAQSGAGGLDGSIPNEGPCTTVTVKCEEIVDPVTGKPKPGVVAEAHRPTCQIRLTPEACKTLGLSGKSYSSEDFEKILDECPKDDLEQALTCCTAKHEKTHLDDGPKPHSCETEENAFGAAIVCLTKAKQAGCGDGDGWDDFDCEAVDEDIASYERGKDFNICVCSKLNPDMILTKNECASCYEACIAGLGSNPDPSETKNCKNMDCQYCSKFITDGSGPSDGCP